MIHNTNDERRCPDGLYKKRKRAYENALCLYCSPGPHCLNDLIIPAAGQWDSQVKREEQR